MYSRCIEDCLSELYNFIIKKVKKIVFSLSCDMSKTLLMMMIGDNRKHPSFSE